MLQGMAGFSLPWNGIADGVAGLLDKSSRHEPFGLPRQHNSSH
ncbi:hypothetical protein [Xenophilus sp. Marseille-Q4582]|nr:hypothetical protein [Xenophilus sp. Marseille-Q4582]